MNRWVFLVLLIAVQLTVAAPSFAEKNKVLFQDIPDLVVCQKFISPAAADCRTERAFCAGCGGDGSLDTDTCIRLLNRRYDYLDSFINSGCFITYADNILLPLYEPYEDTLHCCDGPLL